MNKKLAFLALMAFMACAQANPDAQNATKAAVTAPVAALVAQPGSPAGALILPVAAAVPVVAPVAAMRNFIRVH